MEVFCRNLPPDLSDRSFEVQLQPFMQSLNIRYFVCEKKRRAKFGQIVFLNKSDGDKFLQHHGVITLGHSRARSQFKHPPQQARLNLMGTNVYCEISNRMPDELVLRGIKLQIDGRRSDPDKQEGSAVVFSAIGVDCGYYAFDSESLTFVAEWTGRQICTVKFTTRNVVIKMPSRDIELYIPFQSIVELVWSHDGSVALSLSSSPMFLRTPPADNLAAIFGQLGLGNPAGPTELQAMRLPFIDQEHGRIAGICRVYHFKVLGIHSKASVADLYDNMTKLKKKKVFNVTQYDLKIKTAHATGIIRLAMNELNHFLSRFTASGALPFDLLFLLEALAHNGYLHPATVMKLAERLSYKFTEAAKAKERPPISVEAFKKLFTAIDYPSPHADHTQYEVDSILDFLEATEQDMKAGFALRSGLFSNTDSLIRIFRATVTPTRITFHGPEFETKNRILRKFPDHTDYFMRVQFCDENGRDLFISPRVSLDEVYSRFKSVLSNGIGIAGRQYNFLGFSHSSLRSHSVWLSAPFVHQSRLHWADYIILGLGDFKAIKSPARRAARIGQAFSETPYTVSLDEHEITVVKIPDVEKNSRVFSDGVAPMSLGAVEVLCQALPESKGFPTCYQIRWAGAKGMLSLDTTLDGRVICVRPSMEKFESDDKGALEICDASSKPIPMVLNRQLIKIMEDMGVPHQWFLDLQEKELQRLRGITASVFATANFLKAQLIGAGIRLPQFLRQTENMGIDYRKDAFLRSAVEAAVLRELRLLKHKARIPVQHGMTLFGIMDEIGDLKEGEVFVTYDTMSGRFDAPPEAGPVLVARSPALHPGDVQIAMNVVPPDGHPLTQLQNCIVFSQHGARDLPSQLSGGDLDGDLFHVIWCPGAIDGVVSFPPADYPRIPPLELDRPVESRDMAEFFIDFMKTDYLGAIAVRHMILADQKDRGTNDQDCITLAELHSSAVDFSKTGRAVEMSKLPKANRWRPDFLAQGPGIHFHSKSDMMVLDEHIHQEDDEDMIIGAAPRHRFYVSDKVLGRLYRAVDESKIWQEDIRMKVPMGGASFWDQTITALTLRVRDTIGDVEWKHRSAEAKRIRHAYEDAIFGAMCDHSERPSQPLKELEVFVGFIMDSTGVQTHRQRDRSIKLKDDFERIAGWIMKQMTSPTSISGHTSELDALELCLACLHVGCLKDEREVQPWTRYATGEIKSFRVVAASAVIRQLKLLEGGFTTRAQGSGSGFVGVGSAAPKKKTTGQRPGKENEASARNKGGQTELADAILKTFKRDD
ncbi:RNA dependent RNA polymerase-domain-containing protein [Podospora didyma]|uniref:RNA-dependent RNA polymerase n=1 Tax=Podospora didyma TaxID=330526 RepID=A0AAE0NUZ1_9PEZI|nr:RNA dependent RNA polymerase-domain-containing protein [Podospora didyma]